MRFEIILICLMTFTSTLCSASQKSDEINYTLIIFPDFCIPKIFSFDMECIKLTMSKTLSLGILVGSLAYKVPQIYIIMKNKSAEGISVQSYIFEMLSNASNIIYFYYKGIPIKNYGENISLIVQNFLGKLYSFNKY